MARHVNTNKSSPSKITSVQAAFEKATTKAIQETPSTMEAEGEKGSRKPPLIAEDLAAVLNALGRAVVARREAMGMSQADLAEIMEVTQSLFTAIDNGRAPNTPLSRAVQLRQVLGIDLNRIADEAICKADVGRLKKFHEEHAKEIEDEIKKAEASLASLKERRAIAARIANKDVL